MAVKQVVLSDISGDEVSDENHAKVLVKHPDLGYDVELDLSTEEAGLLTNTSLRLIEFTIHEPNQPPRRAVMETKAADKVFPHADLWKIIENGKRAEAGAPRRGRPAKAAAPKSSGEKVDYTSPDRYGQLHRGRLTEEESRLVRENPDRASKNREAQTGKPIDFNDPAEKKRYGL